MVFQIEHKPKEEPLDQLIDIFNELIILIINYHLIYFTNFVNPQEQLWMGRSVMICILIYLMAFATLILIKSSRWARLYLRRAL